jgi:hypothetical protein
MHTAFVGARPFNATTLPPFKLNNYGGNFGGSIIKNKLFFFVNNEGLQQVLDQPLNGFVPSEVYRNAVLAKSPALAPIISAYPLGLASGANRNVDLWYGSGVQMQNEDSGLFRIDYQIDNCTQLSLRFNTDHFTSVAPQLAGGGTYLTDTGFNNLKTPNAMIDLQHTFSPTMMNDAGFGFNRSEFAQGQTTALPYAVSITGLSSLNNPSGSIRNDNPFTFVDDATFVKGPHTFKTGIIIVRIQENKASPNTPNETLSFTNTTDFMNDVLNSDSYSGTVPVTGQRMTQYAGYALDEFELHSNVTLNLGLRYEYFGVDHEVLGRGIVVDPVTCPNVIRPAGSSWYQPNTHDFSPRVSVAWSPDLFHRKTVIRSGFGIFYGRGQFGNLGGPVSNITNNYTLNQTLAATGRDGPCSTGRVRVMASGYGVKNGNGARSGRMREFVLS